MLKVITANEKLYILLIGLNFFHNEMEYFTLSNAMKYLEKTAEYFPDQ